MSTSEENRASVSRVLTNEMKARGQTLCVNPLCRRIIHLTAEDKAFAYLCDECMQTPLASFVGVK